MSPALPQADRKDRIVHLTGEDLLDAALVRQVAGVDMERLFFDEGGRKERKSVDVVPMGMGQQQVAVLDAFGEDLPSEITDTRAAVEDEHMIAGIDLKTGRVSAVLQMAR